jgi:hypothetical protein
VIGRVEARRAKLLAAEESGDTAADEPTGERLPDEEGWTPEQERWTPEELALAAEGDARAKAAARDRDGS